MDKRKKKVAKKIKERLDVQDTMEIKQTMMLLALCLNDLLKEVYANKQAPNNVESNFSAMRDSAARLFEVPKEGFR